MGRDGLETGSYFVVQRVPKRYHSVEERRHVWISLHTDSLTAARRKAPGVWDGILKSWEARLACDTTDAEARYEAARNLAQSYGFDYVPMEKLVKQPVYKVIERIEAAHDKFGKPNMKDAEALLGLVPKPNINTETAPNAYWTLARDKTLGKSDDQIRRWRNPRIKAFNNFHKVCGVMVLDPLTQDHMLDFREWLMQRVIMGEITPNSANKDLVHLTGVLRLVNTKKRLNLNLPLSGLKIKESDGPAKRRSFSRQWIE